MNRQIPGLTRTTLCRIRCHFPEIFLIGSRLIRIGRQLEQGNSINPDEVNIDPINATSIQAELDNIISIKEENSQRNKGFDEKQAKFAHEVTAKSAIDHSIFVTKLSLNTNADDVENHFADCGKVVWVHGLDFDRGHTDFYSTCVVCFQTPEAAQEAVRKKHGTRLRTFRIDVAMLEADNRKVTRGSGQKLQKPIAALAERKMPVLLSPPV